MAYSPVEWNTGDVITAAKLNNMDGGIVNNEDNINELSSNLDSYFMIRTYTATYSIDPSPNYVNIDNTALNRTVINGYKPVAVAGWQTGNRYAVAQHIKPNIETSTGSVVTILNTGSSAINDSTFTLYVLYVKESLKLT